MRITHLDEVSELGGFYIFTITTNNTHRIITFRMTPTTMPAERSLSYIFTIFAHVTCHASPTHWRQSTGSGEMSCSCSSLSPSSIAIARSRRSSHFHLDPLVSSVSHLPGSFRSRRPSPSRALRHRSPAAAAARRPVRRGCRAPGPLPAPLLQDPCRAAWARAR